MINEIPKIRNIGAAHFIDDIDVSIASYEEYFVAAKSMYSLFIPYFTYKTLPPFLPCSKIFKEKENSDKCLNDKKLFDLMTKYFCYERDLDVSKINLIHRFATWDKFVSLSETKLKRI